MEANMERTVGEYYQTTLDQGATALIVEPGRKFNREAAEEDRREPGCSGIRRISPGDPRQPEVYGGVTVYSR
jgi:hypothetical protein